MRLFYILESDDFVIPNTSADREIAAAHEGRPGV
jgi:hypothetical protein